MEHKSTITIETDRLILRQFCAADAEPAYRNWTSSEKVTRFLTWPVHASVDDTRDILAQWMADYARPDFYQWAIVLRELGEPIGSISAVGIVECIDAVEIGYCIGEPWWRQGITSEALCAVVAFFFDEVKARRVCAKHDTRNPNSGRVMRKAGMTYEGTLRQAGTSNAGIADLCIYSILAREWEARPPRNAAGT